MSNNDHRFHGRVIEALTVDFWNTIAHDTTFEERKELRRNRVYEWLTSHNVDISREAAFAMMDEYSKIWHETWRLKQRTLTAHEAAEWVLDKHPVTDKGARESLAKVIDSVLLDVPPVPVEGVRDALKELAAEFPLALICDTGLSGGTSIDSLLEQWGLLVLFPVRIYSEDLGVSKPNSRMFLTAAEKLGIPYHRIVHIGDLDPTDIFGAKNLGMGAIRFDGATEEAACKPCSMADDILKSWTEITDLLLAGKEEVA